MSKLSKRNKELFESRPEYLVPLTIKLPHEIHKLAIELAKTIVFGKTTWHNRTGNPGLVEKAFSSWRTQTEEGQKAGSEAFNIAIRQNQIEAQKYLRAEFFKCRPDLEKLLNAKKSTSPTGYSREDLGRVFADAIEIAHTKLKNKYLKGE